MIMKNMQEWVRDLIANPIRCAIPVMTHPGVEFLDCTVFDVVTDGQVHFDALKAVNDHYPSAAATTVMDLTVEAEAFGASVHFSSNEVPSVTGSIVSDRASVEALALPTLDAGRLPEYLKASRLAAENLDRPVFSGCIGPFSLAGRLFDMTEIMTTCYLDPDLVHLLLQKCTDFLLTWARALKEAGTQGIVMAEPAAGLLDGDFCEEFSSRYVKQIVDAVQDEHFLIILHNCGNKGQCTEAMLSTNAAGLHFGNAIDMELALNQCPSSILVMGNIDPVLQFQMATPEELFQITLDLLERTKSYPNFVLSSGCDTPPGTPIENIEAFYRALNVFNSKKSLE
jgi:uroporphyrinogen decarboxylase